MTPRHDSQPQLNDLQTYFVHEFVQEYKDGHMSRRDMMRRVLYIAGGIASTATLLTSLGCAPSAPAAPTSAPTAPKPTAAASPAAAAASPAASPSPASGARSPLSVPANDPAVQAASVTFSSGGATVMGYQARPASGSGPFAAVLICHENRGLTDHIRDVTRRYAKAGYVALSIDLLSREGGTSQVADPAQIPSILSSSQNVGRHVEDFTSAMEHLKSQGSLVRGDRIGMTGFCFGGGITWRTAAAVPEFRAASPYYGSPPPLEQVPNIKAAVFGVYSSDPNDFANNNRDRLEAALRAAGVTYEIKVYPGTRHAFHNDTGSAWSPEQGPAAFRDTLAWFERYLKM